MWASTREQEINELLAEEAAFEERIESIIDLVEEYYEGDVEEAVREMVAYHDWDGNYILTYIDDYVDEDALEFYGKQFYLKKKHR